VGTAGVLNGDGCGRRPRGVWARCAFGDQTAFSDGTAAGTFACGGKQTHRSIAAGQTVARLASLKAGAFTKLDLS
jgi:hypothetical protein